MAAGVALPKSVFAHGFLLTKGEKMSKSKGNVLAPADLVERFGVDAYRYYFLRDVQFGADGSISMESMVQRYNGDLANDWGNLCSRLFNMTEKYLDGAVPAAPSGPDTDGDATLKSFAGFLPEKYEQAMSRLDYVRALEATWDLIKDGNRYIEQEAPLGLAHAVKVSQPYLGDDSFVMYLGDNLIKDGITPLVEEFRQTRPNCQILLAHVPNPEMFGVAELEADRVVRLVEKPKEPPTDLALVGVYMFDSTIFEAVNAIEPSWRDEFEITDAIQYLIDHGRSVHPHIIEGWWKDTGKLEDLLEANMIMLDHLEGQIDGSVDEASTIAGKVVIGKGAEICASTIRGPAIIGAKTRIANSYVGPFTSIHDNVVIESSEVEHCIIMPGARIEQIGHRLSDSLLGCNVKVTKTERRPASFKLMLGDNSEVEVV